MAEIYSVAIEEKDFGVIVLTDDEAEDHFKKTGTELTIFTLVADDKQDALEKSVKNGLMANAIEIFQHIVSLGPDTGMGDDKILANLQRIQEQYQPV